MANKQNLRPQAHVLTVDEQSKGGKKSGETRRKRKTLAEIGNMLGEIKVKSLEIRKMLDQAGFEEEDVTNDVVMLYNLLVKAKTGDAKSIELLAKLRGQFKEQAQVELAEVKPLVDLTKRRKNGEGE